MLEYYSSGVPFINNIIALEFMMLSRRDFKVSLIPIESAAMVFNPNKKIFASKVRNSGIYGWQLLLNNH